MPSYKIYRLKDNLAVNFRWAPHTPGLTQIKPKDYEEAGEVEAGNVYAAWTTLAGTGSPLRVGDVIESGTNQLRICKYVGFEEAQWVLPEPVAQPEAGQAPHAG